jgi:hypothetical protein
VRGARLMRRKDIGILVIAVIVAAVIGGGAAFWLRHKDAETVRTTSSTTSTLPTGGAPSSAITTIQELTSGGTAAAQRRAVTPELNSLLPAGRLFPAGTTFTPAPHSWHRSGAYANTSGTLKEPGQPAVPVEIGLVLRGGSWLVTFEEQQ